MRAAGGLGRVLLALAALAASWGLPGAATAQQSADDSTHLQLPEPRLLRAGERAPFEGQLIAQDDLMRWALRIEELEHRLTADLDAARRVCDAQLGLERARTQAEVDKRALHDQLYQNRIDALAEDVRRTRGEVMRQWYESPLLWFIVGVVLTGATAVVLAVAM